MRTGTLAAAAVVLLQSIPADAQHIKEGKPAPAIDLPTLNGGRMQLSKLRGHPVVLSFWATWCPPCRYEFPELMRVHSKYSSSGLFVIGVNGRDQESETKDVQRFVDFFSVSFPILLDQRGSARRAYRIEGEPTTVFIDSGGVVRRVHTGLINREQLDSGVALIMPPLTLPRRDLE
jgi:Thiol-disulfide isomerase and thioredoxins